MSARCFFYPSWVNRGRSISTSMDVCKLQSAANQFERKEIMSTCKGYAAAKPKAPLGPYSFERREPREHDVVIEIKYCGICHSDIHQARNEWSEYQEEAIFPMVPGHEIAGIVTAVGSKVSKYKVGDKVGVGCYRRFVPHVSRVQGGDGAVLQRANGLDLQRTRSTGRADLWRLFRPHRR